GGSLVAVSLKYTLYIYLHYTPGGRDSATASTAVSASSMMPTAISISSSVIDNGGGMREQFNIPLVERTMFMDRPRRRHSSLTATPSASAGFFVVRSSTSSSPTSNPFPRTSPICS